MAWVSAGVYNYKWLMNALFQTCVIVFKKALVYVLVPVLVLINWGIGKTCLADFKILLTMKWDLKPFIRYGIGIHNLRQLLKNIWQKL